MKIVVKHTVYHLIGIFLFAILGGLIGCSRGSGSWISDDGGTTSYTVTDLPVNGNSISDSVI